MQELYETTTTIDGYFESVIDSDISAFATYVEDASIDFCCMLGRTSRNISVYPTLLQRCGKDWMLIHAYDNYN